MFTALSGTLFGGYCSTMYVQRLQLAFPSVRPGVTLATMVRLLTIPAVLGVNCRLNLWKPARRGHRTGPQVCGHLVQNKCTENRNSGA